MKKTVFLLSCLLLLAVMSAVRATTATNILSPTFINSGITNGTPVAYATIALPPLQYIYSSAGLTNANGTNGSSLTGTIILSGTNIFTLQPSQTGNTSDVGTVTITNLIIYVSCTATNWGTNNVQFQLLRN